MDQNKSSFNSSNKASQIIMLSLSVVAFIAFQYSSLFSSIKLLSYSSTDRHYIFLICNGLMLLVIKSSGLFAGSNPPGTEFYRDSHVIRNSQHQPAGFRENINVKANVISHQYTCTNKNTVELPTDELAETKADSCIKVVAKVEEAQGETTVMDNVTSTADYEEQEEGNDLINLIDEQQEQEQEQEQEEEEVRQKDEQVQEQEHEILLWSTEELNKKCDDFIRKMKYGIKYEARLVMV